jgi:hypothetical protein
MGEGAAAPFIGVHIMGEIRLAGGFDTLAESRWEDRIGPSIPVQKINHHNQPSGASLCSANWSGDGTAALFVATEIRGNIRRLRGWKRRHGQLVTGRSISMGPPALSP